MLEGAHPLEVIIRALFTGMGGLLLLFLLWMTFGNIRIIQTYEHARAEVIDCERIGPVASKGLNHFFVQVRYIGASGRPVTAEVDGATTKYEVGEVIDVYYKAETGYKVVGGDFMQMWFHTVVVAAVSFLMLFFGLKPTRAVK